MKAVALIRSRLGVTQAELAAGIGVTQANVSFYEVRGQRMPPDVALRLIEFAKAKGVQIRFDDVYMDLVNPSPAKAD